MWKSVPPEKDEMALASCTRVAARAYLLLAIKPEEVNRGECLVEKLCKGRLRERRWPWKATRKCHEIEVEKNEVDCWSKWQE